LYVSSSRNTGWSQPVSSMSILPFCLCPKQHTALAITRTLSAPAQVAAATSSLMVVFSSSAALISFAVDGRVNGAYAGVYSAASVVASLVGVLVINDKASSAVIGGVV